MLSHAAGSSERRSPVNAACIRTILIQLQEGEDGQMRENRKGSVRRGLKDGAEFDKAKDICVV